MEQVTITSKIQIMVNDDNDKQLLDDTMHAYKRACNYVSDYVFKTHDLKQFSLNKALYSDLRDKFNLKSQMAQSVLKSVIARYKTILENDNKWIKPSFKKSQYDLVWNRDYSLNKNMFSINTLNGRIKFNYYSKGFDKYFNSDLYKFGTSKLVYKHNKYFLHIPIIITVNETKLDDICNVVGIDRGINFVVATYDSKHKTKLISGKAIKQKRARYSKLRKQLQQVKTPSSRKRLKAIGQRENRWMKDVNHQISKALVNSNPKHSLFVLEDLKGIRKATEKVRVKDRYVSVSWSYYDLEQKLIYKAKLNESKVIKVDPRYTSQTCPMCGCIDKSNRNKKIHLFTCKNCGYKSNDDRIAAMNLHQMGINYLIDNKVPVIVE